MKKLFFSVGLFLLGTSAFSQQKIYEGTVTYQVEWQLPANAGPMAANLPKEITVFFKGDSTATVFKSPMSNTNTILNAKKEYMRLLLDIPLMQKKISVIFTPDDQEQMKEMSPEFSLKAGTETKSIAGYNGKKYEVSEKKSGQNFEAWFTTEVDIPQNTATLFYDKSYGFPLQFSTIINRVPVKALVKEIKATTVPAGIFTATKDYEEMTFQELMNMMPGRK